MDESSYIEIRPKSRGLSNVSFASYTESGTVQSEKNSEALDLLKENIFGCKEPKEAIFNFHTFLVVYLLGLSLIFAPALSYIDNIKYVDAFFYCISAITSTGLATLSMKDLTAGSFIIIAVLMFLGNICVIQLINLIFRLRSADNFIITVKKSSMGKIPEIVSKIENIRDSIRVVWWVFYIYLILNHVLGFLLYLGALYIRDHEPELLERGYLVADNALFIVISTLANSGFSISSSSVYYTKNNFFAYFILAMLTLTGNTLAPILLRQLLRFFKRINFCSVQDSVYDYVLENPRKISWYIFGAVETKVLFESVVLLNVFFYIFYVGCTYSDHVMSAAYGDDATLAGMGAFQIIVLRSSGLQIMDFRLLNQGLLILFAIAMYIPTAPFIGQAFTDKEVAEARKIYEKRGMTASSVSSDYDDLNGDDQTNDLYSLQFIKKHIFRHTFFLILSAATCCAVESNDLRTHPEVNNIFYTIFELVSAYGNVGVSMGVPGEAYSLCGKFHTVSKLIVIFVMLLGKFRGIPKLYDEVIDYNFVQARRVVFRALLDAKQREKSKRVPAPAPVPDDEIPPPVVLETVSEYDDRHLLININAGDEDEDEDVNVKF